MKHFPTKLCFIFLAVATVFFCVRSSVGLVWNDSPQTAENIYGFYEQTLPAVTQDSVCREQGVYGLRFSLPHLAETVLKRSFSCLEFGGYRPLSSALSLFAVSIFSDDSIGPQWQTIWLAFVASLFGLLAVLIFLLAKKYVQSDLTAAFILIFFFFSPPMLTGAWIIFSGGIQVTVPLFICLGLYCYEELSDSSLVHRPFRKTILSMGLIAVLFLGPWIREYIGIVALLILFLELQKKRRLTPMFFLALVSFLHAVYPTALAHFYASELPIRPVFQLGSLAAQLDADNQNFIIRVLEQMKWNVAHIFLLTLPPTFLFISLSIVILSVAKKRLNWILLGAFALAFILWNEKVWFYPLAILFFCAVSMLLSWQKENRNRLNKVIFLNIWFLLSILPFFKVFSAHVHLAYPLIPAALLLATTLESLWFRSQITRQAKIVLVSILAFFAMDQILLLYGSFTTVKGLYGSIETMARWFQVNSPQGTIVIANAPHAEDIRFYSKNHILPFWTVGVGVPPERTLEAPEKLQTFLKKHIEKEKIVMLNIQQDFARHKGNFHGHKYLLRQTADLSPTRKIHSFSARYFYLDPLRNFLSRENILFLGPPDLENDIYTGHSRDGRKFFNEVSAEYEVADVLSANVSPLAGILPNNTFYFSAYIETYKDYSLFGYRHEFMAIPNSAHIDPDAIPENQKQSVFFSKSPSALKQLIDQKSLE